MDKNEFITFLTQHGWEKDKWGHLKITTSDGRVFRWKFQKKTTRLEVQRPKTYGRENEWFRYRSLYYTQMTITNGKIGGKMLKTFMEAFFGATLKVPEEITSIMDGF